jgi:hypothetical protein
VMVVVARSTSITTTTRSVNSSGEVSAGRR